MTEKEAYDIVRVSIHAPARGATIFTNIQMAEIISFNPRAREGRDQGWAYIMTLYYCFNPRAREGRDKIEDGEIIHNSVSIHAPARGATA